jgi:hypothetical protein
LATADLTDGELVLFVQLLSGMARNPLENSELAFPVIQHRLAQEQGAPILQWCDPTTEIEKVTDAEHLRLLNLQR